jgi:hypothetical protein
MKTHIRILLLSIMASLTISGTASAATVVWQGGAGSFTDANWTVDGTPDQNAPNFGSGDVQFTISGGTVNDFTNANTATAAGSGDTILITGGGAIVGDYMRPNAGNTPLYTTLLSGSITMSDPNSFRTASGNFSGNINFTGAAGSAFVTQTDNSGTSDLAIKVSQGFFAIDGTKITTVLYNETNLAAVNADLATQIFSNRYFEITDLAGVQTLNLVAVPEPSSFALLGLGVIVLGLLRRRR